MNQFNVNNFEKVIKPDQIENKQGWVDETEFYKNKVVDFIKNYYSSEHGYNSITEFHISGDNSKVLRGAYNGEVLPTKIEFWYEHNNPKQIHVLYEGQDTGHSIDFYISGKALEDFLVE